MPTKALIKLFNFHIIKFSFFYDFDKLSRNKYLLPSTILKLPDKNWNWYRLSKNPIIDSNTVFSLPHKRWDFHWLTMHKNISYNDIITHLDCDWSWTNVTGRFPEYINDPQVVKKVQEFQAPFKNVVVLGRAPFTQVINDNL